MSQTHLFGVELEFAILSYDNVGEDTYLSKTSRTTRFCPRETFANGQIFYENFEPCLKSVSLKHAKIHIAEVLSTHGLNAAASLLGADAESIDEWSVTTDITVFGPKNNGRQSYSTPSGKATTHKDSEWLGMEVTSPAMPLTPDSLQQIEAVCNLLKKNYICYLNNGPSLHVHISGGRDEVLNFKTLRNLMTFLYTFEPQINTLHPEAEQNNWFARGTRHGSEYTNRVADEYGFGPPSALQVMVEANKCSRAQDVIDTFYLPRGVSPRYMDYNLTPIAKYLQAVAKEESGESDSRRSAGYLVKPPGKPTIEFRQHIGTLDADRICAWVKFIVTVYCQDVDQSEFIDLLTHVASTEKWFHRINRDDNKMMLERYGPVPAESSFTIIDLLMAIGLEDSADDYNADDRRWPLVVKDEDGAAEWPDKVVWDYLDEDVQKSLTDEEYQLLHSQKLIWESFQAIRLAETDAGEGPQSATSKSFDPEDRMWPKHVHNGKADGSDSGSDTASRLIRELGL